MALRGEKAVTTFPIAIVRITIVGAAGCGKTRLIDSYVNMPPVDMEWSVASTTERELYHKVVTLRGDQSATILAFQEDTRVLVELEDTPPSTLVQYREELRDGLAQEALIDGGNEAEKMDSRLLKHPMARVLDMTRRSALDVPEGVADLTPFAVFDYPREITQKGRVDVKPISQGRMGFALCFSLLDVTSFTEITEIYYLMNLIKEKRKEILTPLVFVIGTKDDLVGSPETAAETKQIQLMAEDFAGRNGLPFYKVSARSGRNVERCLDELVSQIVQTPSLSAFDIYTPGAETEEDEDSDED